MKKKNKLDLILESMTEAELRDALAETLNEDQELLERFIAKYSDPKDDLKDPEMLAMIECRAQHIADRIAANVSDERGLWQVARSRRGSHYIDEGEAFVAAVEDELYEARQYAGQLAVEGHVELAVVFSRLAGEKINAALESSDYPAEWAGFDITDIWEDILRNVKGPLRKKAFQSLLEQVESEENPGWYFDFLCRHVEPDFSDQLLKTLDKRIAEEMNTPAFRNSFEIPNDLSLRRRVMKATGATVEDFNTYLATFKNCAFGLVRILAKTEKLKDVRGAMAACKALLEFDLDAEQRRKFSEKLSRYQAQSGDIAGEAETLSLAVKHCVAGLGELQRLRELLPAREWATMLEGFFQSVTQNNETYPGLYNCGCLLLEAQDWDRLWKLVSASPLKQDWLQFEDALVSRHPDEYGDFLLGHLGVDEPRDAFRWPGRRRVPMQDIYGEWARTIKHAAEISGQREKAMKLARELAEVYAKSRPFKTVWLEQGLPGFESTTKKTAKPVKRC